MTRESLALLLILGVTTIQAAGDEPAPTITTALGKGGQAYGKGSDPSRQPTLNNPFDVAFDRSGNLYLSDTFNHSVLKVDARTGVVVTAAGNCRKGFSGDGGPALSATMDEPYGIVLDAENNLFIADRLNRRVRKVDGKTALISTVAGNGSKTFSGDGGLATKAGLVEPNGVALDPSGKTLLIADVSGNRIRALDLTTGLITTYAGTGKGRHEGDGGPAVSASIAGARAVEFGPDGTVYLLERQGNTLRAIDPKTATIRTVAGTGAKGNSGDGGPALKATFNGPKELAVDSSGNLYIVDTENHAIRRIDIKTGLISTIAGNGRKGAGGDGGPATAASLARPHGVAVGADGSVYIGDTENHRIRKVAISR